jgi:hypothetical protein
MASAVDEACRGKQDWTTGQEVMIHPVETLLEPACPDVWPESGSQWDMFCFGETLAMSTGPTLARGRACGGVRCDGDRRGGERVQW